MKRDKRKFKRESRKSKSKMLLRRAMICLMMILMPEIDTTASGTI